MSKREAEDVPPGDTPPLAKPYSPGAVPRELVGATPTFPPGDGRARVALVEHPDPLCRSRALVSLARGEQENSYELCGWEPQGLVAGLSADFAGAKVQNTASIRKAEDYAGLITSMYFDVPAAVKPEMLASLLARVMKGDLPGFAGIADAQSCFSSAHRAFTRLRDAAGRPPLVVTRAAHSLSSGESKLFGSAAKTSSLAEILADDEGKGDDLYKPVRSTIQLTGARTKSGSKGNDKVGRRDADVETLRGVANWALSYGKDKGFWIWNNWWQSNWDAGSSRLTYEDSFVYSDGSRIKRLVCGESAHFMMQAILLTRARGEYVSDLVARIAIARGGFLGFGGQNRPLGFHVWVEIATAQDPGNIHLKIDLWAGGTNAGAAFPEGAPLDMIRDEFLEEATPLTPKQGFTVGPAPGR